MPATQFTVVGVLFILCASSISCQDSEDSPPLTIDPFRWTAEVGKVGTFKCIISPSTNMTHILWFYPDNVTEILPESNSTTSRIYVDRESQLQITNAQENDTGLYLCKATSDISVNTAPVVTIPTTIAQLPVSNSTDGLVSYSTAAQSNMVPYPQQMETEAPEMYNTTVAIKIYVMPTYFTEGMIILGINLGLLLVFLICLTQSVVSERKRMQTCYKK